MIGTEERTNAKTGNVDKMTVKQLVSDLSESHTFGAESSGLGTAALAKRSAVAASIDTGSDALESDDDGLRRPVKKRAAGADLACSALSCACAARASGRLQRQHKPRQTREGGGPSGILGFLHVRDDVSRFFLSFSTASRSMPNMC